MEKMQFSLTDFFKLIFAEEILSIKGNNTLAYMAGFIKRSIKSEYLKEIIAFYDDDEFPLVALTHEDVLSCLLSIHKSLGHHSKEFIDLLR